MIKVCGGDFTNSILIGAFLLAGAALGFEILNIARKISLYKCNKKNINIDSNFNFTSEFLKFGLCVFNAVAWVISYLFIENVLTAILSAILFTIAVLIAIIDWQIRIIPNEILLVMIASGIAFQAIQFGFKAVLISMLSMIAMIIFFLTVAGITGFDKVGAGDIKLAGAMGLTLGYPNIITALIIMSLAFLIWIAGGLAIKKLKFRSTLPFAPFMMTGMILALGCMMR